MEGLVRAKMLAKCMIWSASMLVAATVVAPISTQALLECCCQSVVIVCASMATPACHCMVLQSVFAEFVCIECCTLHVVTFQGATWQLCFQLHSDASGGERTHCSSYSYSYSKCFLRFA